MDYLKPYSHTRGFNYVPSTAYNDIAFWRDYDEALVERELTYAQRLGLNSARVFLAYVVYEREPRAFLGCLRHFTRAAHDRGISVVPVIWDSCFSDARPEYDCQVNDWFPNPGVQRLGPDFWPAGERYCQELVDTLGPELGLAIWDVMNEPMVTTWIRQEEPERGRRVQTIWTFAHHFCAFMKRIDSAHPITVGVSRAPQLVEIGPDVDVLSFHDYGPTRAAIRAHFDEAIGFARALEKPILVSEIACLARANPYDVTLEICQRLGMGWYLWELMIGVSRWRQIHGFVYPDGTIRDPSIVAAVQGFFRRRTGEIVRANVDTEGRATRTLGEADEWLGQANASYADGLRILEQIANMLEAGELVPLTELPSAKVMALAEETPANRATLYRLLVRWSETVAGDVRR
ncbi:MAG: hypothetical protein HYY04_06790 [Chloroflexi bacterium]|nr:hypothetical protein [Chloroflexota bacterium]